MTDLRHKHGNKVAQGGQKGVYKYAIFADTKVEGYKLTFFHLEFDDIVNGQEHACFSDLEGVQQYLTVVKHVATGRISQKDMPGILETIGTDSFEKTFAKAKRAQTLRERKSYANQTIAAITKAIQGESE